jgi:hypothetical protein
MGRGSGKGRRREVDKYNPIYGMKNIYLHIVNSHHLRTCIYKYLEQTRAGDLILSSSWKKGRKKDPILLKYDTAECKDALFL